MTFQCIRTSQIGKAERLRCLALMEPTRRAAVERITHKDVRVSTVCGEWLAKTMLALASGRPVEAIALRRDENGKPYPVDLPLYLSISHSGDRVACAVSERPVGLDLEMIRPRDLSVAKRICSPQELAFIFTEHKGSDPLSQINTRGLTPCVNEQESLRRFLRVWTAKEAAVKLSGIGIKGMREADYFALLPRLQTHETEEYLLSIVR